MSVKSLYEMPKGRPVMFTAEEIEYLKQALELQSKYDDDYEDDPEKVKAVRKSIYDKLGIEAEWDE